MSIDSPLYHNQIDFLNRQDTERIDDLLSFAGGHGLRDVPGYYIEKLTEHLNR